MPWMGAINGSKAVLKKKIQKPSSTTWLEIQCQSIGFVPLKKKKKKIVTYKIAIGCWQRIDSLPLFFILW
jgi:hypothetical protein